MLYEYTQRFVAYGFLGFMIEVVFTGLHNIIVLGSKKAAGHTYLWMFPVYGSGGSLLEQIMLFMKSSHLSPMLSMVSCILLMTLAIYVMEFTWGAVFEYIIGICPWKYTNSDGVTIHKNSILGYIRLDYFLFWLGLAGVFYMYGEKLKIILNMISHI